MRSRLLFRLSVAVIGVIAVAAFGIHIRMPAASYAAVGNRGDFTPAACIQYPSATGDSAGTIFIDPGHGGLDPGATGALPGGASINEKTLTLAVALHMVPSLQRAGYTVVLSRIRDTSVTPLKPGYMDYGLYTPAGEHADIEARIDCANSVHARLLLSIHFNSYQDSSVGGVETLYDAARPFASQNIALANVVQRKVLAGFSAAGWTIPDRGVTSDALAGTPGFSAEANAYGHVLELGPAAAGWLKHPSRMPGVLCEPLFLTDPIEGQIADSTRGQAVLAKSLVGAIETYMARHAR